MFRVNHFPLPSVEELRVLTDSESSRRARTIYEISESDELFKNLIRLVKAAGCGHGFISRHKEHTLTELLDACNQTKSACLEWIKAHQAETELYTAVYSSLSYQQAPKKSDAIFVFGSFADARVKSAAKLYKDGLAPKIILSGDRPHWHNEKVSSEAQRMASVAVRSGVPKNTLILEERAITIPDNVKRTIDMLEVADFRPTSLILVVSPFALRRASIDWHKFCPWNITTYGVAAQPADSKYRSDNWWRSEDGVNVIFNEYAKICIESKIDTLLARGRPIE